MLAAVPQGFGLV